MSVITNSDITGTATIKSSYTTCWIGQTNDLYYETSFLYGDYTGLRLGNSLGFITAYPHATFATIGFNNYVEDEYIYVEPQFNLTGIVATTYPPFFFIPPFIPTPPVSEPSSLLLLISGLLMVYFYKKWT